MKMSRRPWRRTCNKGIRESTHGGAVAQHLAPRAVGVTRPSGPRRGSAATLTSDWSRPFAVESMCATHPLENRAVECDGVRPDTCGLTRIVGNGAVRLLLDHLQRDIPGSFLDSRHRFPVRVGQLLKSTHVE